ncbi:hypothetical protein KXD97_26375 [Mycobacterium sp. SMC-8]|uniref:hypothetical protein n=1 Tax=Mycobacterium sp. SMC-8 TaxID=2857060 RepID=UPI0021B27A36|nr:hypothetical protein [Mycobacterium sp. SMC-8]UXA11499.1 hypothetical protein KXD97_26375 [Mycobacterium sp. SMC-8]
MTRLMILAAAAVSTALAAGTGVAGAEPDVTSAEPYCTFTLTAPQRVANGNTYAVVSTLKAQHCNGTSNARRATVCLSGDGGTETCGEAVGWGVARVAVPWTAGRTYTATGRGCADPGIPFPVTTCIPNESVSVTL